MHMAKTVWTASYAKALKMPRTIVLIATSRSVPEWFSTTGVPYRHMMELAPTKEVLAKSKADPEYDWKTAYRRQLSETNLKWWYDALPAECAMLCWEKEWEQCHRKLLFEAFHAVFGVAGGEWGGGNPIHEQLSMF